MEKKLIIYRHAKASHEDFSISDFDRTLIKKGVTDAEHIALLFGKTLPLPDLILCSSAIRTRQTIAPLLKQYPKIDCSYTDSLYLASAQEIINLVETVSASYSNLLLCGHNPGLTDFINEVSSTYIDDIPTACVVVITFDSNSWKNLLDGRVVHYITPKNWNL